MPVVAQPPFGQWVAQLSTKAKGFGIAFALVRRGVSREPPGSNWPWERWYNDPGRFFSTEPPGVAGRGRGSSRTRVAFFAPSHCRYVPAIDPSVIDIKRTT